MWLGGAMLDEPDAEAVAEEAKPELTIADVLVHYGAESVPSGIGWHTMKCPFHEDSTNSAGVNTGVDAFTCHACPYSGGPISLIMRKESLGREEAHEFARSVLGASVSRIQRSVSKSGKRRPLGRERWKGILG
jgi:DNA primase